MLRRMTIRLSGVPGAILLKADLKAIKDDLYANCDKWPAAYAGWLVFERFTRASIKVQVRSGQ
jgi:hypothetical protein